MNMELTGATSLRLTLDDGPLEITLATDDEEVGFSPLHMLAGSLATCTASVLASYAETAHLHIHGLVLELEWEYTEQPHRVGAYRMNVIVPDDVPEARRKALLRAAEQCTVHATLLHPPTIDIALKADA